jgi:hypothetical protein
MSLAQGVLGAVCKPVSRRTQEIGCWIISDDSIGQLIQSPVFWHLDVLSRERRKVWLMTFEKEDWRLGMTAPADIHSAPDAWLSWQEKRVGKRQAVACKWVVWRAGSSCP